MIYRIAISDSRTFPVVLKFTDIRSYVFTLAFILLSVEVPWIFHQFHLAGPTYLPMHIFVLAAGLLFGWRAGLVVGLFTPLASYTISGMPDLLILPQIVIELSTYGLIAGILREKLNLRVIWALLGAMAGGRLLLLIAVLLIYPVIGESNSPLGAEVNPLLTIYAAIKQGWPGIVIQLCSIPILIFIVKKFITGKRSPHHE